MTGILLIWLLAFGITVGHPQQPTHNNFIPPQVDATTKEDIGILKRDVEEAEKIIHSPVRMLSSFSWSNCGSSSYAASFSSLALSPDPIVIPGNITLSFDGKTSISAASPLTAQITLKKKVFFMWVDIPCVGVVGSCSFDDFCTLLRQVFPPSQGCPSVFTKHNIPCNCPILAGTYSLPPSVFSVPKDPLPPALTDGQYDLKLKIQTSGKKLLCLEVTFKITSK